MSNTQVIDFLLSIEEDIASDNIINNWLFAKRDDVYSLENLCCSPGQMVWIFYIFNKITTNNMLSWWKRTRGTKSHFQIELTIEIRQMSKTTFHYYDFISKTDSHTHAITVWTKQTVPKMSEEILVNLISTVFKLSESKWLLRIYNLWENKKFMFYVNVDYIQWKQNK